MPHHIRAARAALGWTQSDLAREAGCAPVTVKYWENVDRPFERDHKPAAVVPRMKEAFARAGVEITQEAIRFCEPPNK